MAIVTLIAALAVFGVSVLSCVLPKRRTRRRQFLDLDQPVRDGPQDKRAP